MATWESQEAIDAYRTGPEHEEIQRRTRELLSGARATVKNPSTTIAADGGSAAAVAVERLRTVLEALHQALDRVGEIGGEERFQ